MKSLTIKNSIRLDDLVFELKHYQELIYLTINRRCSTEQDGEDMLYYLEKIETINKDIKNIVKEAQR